MVKFDPAKHHRRSIRLKGYDYTQAGAYVVTICTQNRECLFGEIVDESMQLNVSGEVVLACWHDLPHHYARVELDAFVVMPNHVHGIIVLTHTTNNFVLGYRSRKPTEPLVDHLCSCLYARDLSC